MRSLLRRSLLALQRLVLRTQAGPLRPLWALCYAVAVRALARAVRRGEPATAVYVEGSLAERGAVYGLSDIDFSIVTPADPGAPGAARARIREKADRLARRLPGRLDELLYSRVFEQQELEDPEPVFVYGLNRERRDAPPKGLYFGARKSWDRVTLHERPGLYGPMSDWRLVSGPERRADDGRWGVNRRHMAAWLELQIWWRRAVLLARSPDSVGAAYLAVKLVAEPARIWLWLSQGERCESRVAALRRASALLPAEAEAFGEALELHRHLGRRPTVDVPRTLAALTRLSSLIAGRLLADVDDLGTTDVTLLGAKGELMLSQGGWEQQLSASAPKPLADWRALAWPRFPDESFVTLSGSPSDPAKLAACADIERGPFPTLLDDRLLVRPADAHVNRAHLRTIACPISDPVSFALCEGADTAHFAAAPGWSARDWAKRAAAEHATWLAANPTPLEADGETLGRMVSALRAALFLDSVGAGEPRLSLTVAATLDAFAASFGPAREAAESAAEAYADFAAGGHPPPGNLCRELERLVRGLPAYAVEAA
jgi:predicted nucleotidyltransferase